MSSANTASAYPASSTQCASLHNRLSLGMVLTCEGGGLEELDEVAELDEPGGVDVHHGEAGDQVVGQLVVAREEAQSQCRDRADAPGLEKRLKQHFLRLYYLSRFLAPQLRPQRLVQRVCRQRDRQRADQVLRETDVS